MRPAIASNVVRADTAFAWQSKGFTAVPVFTFGLTLLKAIPELGFYVRGAIVHHRPDDGASGTALGDPLFFVLYTPEVAQHLRVSVFAGLTAPVGGGAGNAPDSDARVAVNAAIYARQGMDNALFLTNYVTPTVGLGGAYVNQGLTVQAEATLLNPLRTRGEVVDVDASRTNLTTGLHAGYRVIPLVTVSVEAHYQVWLSTPAPVRADASRRAQATVGAGLRLNLPLSAGVLARPGLAYFHPIDDPMVAADYRVVVLDLPIVF